MTLIKLDNVSKYYKSGEGVSVGMQKISLEFNAGEFVAITGESGSGKSTLLNVISGLDTYEDGELYINDEETSHYLIKDWEAYRAKYVGFIFQNYNIIDSYTVYQNVMLALEIQNYPKEKRKDRALELIEKVGLTSHKNHKAAKLSGGQKQRAVIARALAKDCPIIACDEPTGNLDSESSKQIIKLLNEIAKDKLILIVTHNYDEVKEYATRKIKIHDGEVVEDKAIKKNVEVVKIEEPKESKMTLGAILYFALRNVLSMPKRFIFFLLLQFAVMMIFTNAYANFMRTADSFSLGMSYNNTRINDVVTSNFSDNRFLVIRQDNEPLTANDYNYISTLGSNYFAYKDAFFIDYLEYYTILNDYYRLSANSFNSTYAIRNNDSFLIDGSLNISENQVIVSNYYEDFEVGDEIVISSESWNSRSIEYTVSSDVVTLDINAQKDSIDINIFLKDGKNFSYSLILEDNQFKLSDLGINYEDVALLNIFYFEENIEYRFKIAGIYNDNYGGSIYLPHELLNVTETKAGFMVVAENEIAANRLFNRIDKNTYRVIYPNNQEGELASITAPLKFLVKAFFYVLTIFMGFFLYFLLSTVIKNVMFARMKDFAIYRSIGANQKTIAILVILEQLVIMFFAYIFAILAIMIIRKVDYSTNLVFNYLTFVDYIVLFLTFAFLTFRLATKFNHKTFKISVIENISESKEAGL